MVGYGADSPEVLPAAATFAGGGDSSPTSSAESSFRELDDVFLQTQTRIWLGEVLHTRLNEQISIADLLADGELLFEVSREVWEMLLTGHVELKSVKAYKYELFASRKSSGRYMPYSNVDSFLKICKILGLAGIDLFSPSDVVEKRSTRKVCICIRSLSKKARSRHLNVPDFDIVTYTVAMPTDMVGYIRRSWELSHCSSPSSDSHSPYHESRRRSRQKQSNAGSGRNDNAYSEEYEDTGNCDFMHKSESSTRSCSYDVSSSINCDLVDSPGGNLAVESCSLELQIDVKNHEVDEYTKFQPETEYLNELAGSLYAEHLEFHNQLIDTPTPSSVDSNIPFGDRFPHRENGVRNIYDMNALDLIHIDSYINDGSSVLGEFDEGNTPERNLADDTSSIVCDGPYSNNVILLHGKDSIFCGSCSGKASGRSYENHVDDMEVSSVASVNLTSRPVVNLDFDDRMDAKNDLKNIQIHELLIKKLDLANKKSMEGSEPHEMEVMDTGFSAKHFLSCSDAQCITEYLDHAFSLEKAIFMSQINLSAVDGEEQQLFVDQSRSLYQFQWDQKGKCKVDIVPTRDEGHRTSSICYSQVDSPEETLHFVQSKATKEAFCLKEIRSIITDGDEACGATVKDHEGQAEPNECFHTLCLGNIVDKTCQNSNTVDNNGAAIVESEQSHKLSGIDHDSSCAQHDGNSTCMLHGNTHVHQNPYASCYPGELKADEHSCLTTECSQIVEDTDQLSENQDDVIHQADSVDKEDEEHEKSKIVESAECRRHRRPILKSVIGGTAVVGALLLFLHLRKNGPEKAGEIGKQSSQTQKAKPVSLSSPKEKRDQNVSGVYPAHKLKF